ncbi:MAG TPA: metalloprotease, partial [Salinimicrobium sp.]|nr:metalloprotease [Salinimicrobium sp.]
MIRTFLFSALLFCVVGKMRGQHSVSLTAVLNDSLKTLSVEQELIYHNTSSDTLYNIYLNDWLNAFSSKSTPLAKRFAEDYKREFHFSRQRERGFTRVGSITGKSGKLSWERPKKHPDVIKIDLASPLPPGEKTTIRLKYTIKISSDDFTRYGYSKNGNYKLRYWFLTPAVYEQSWNVYSNKNLNDLFNPPLDLDITLTIPDDLAAVSGLNTETLASGANFKTVHLTGKNRLDYKLYLTRYYLFEEFRAGKTDIITNMDDEGLSPIMRNFEINRIFDFLNSRLGDYPHNTMLATREDYLKNPVYGLGQLPKFIRPFPEGFHYDLKLFKTIS